MTTTRRNGRGYTGRDANVGLVPNTRAPDARVHARVHTRAHEPARVCTCRRVYTYTRSAARRSATTECAETAHRWNRVIYPSFDADKARSSVQLSVICTLARVYEPLIGVIFALIS